MAGWIRVTDMEINFINKENSCACAMYRDNIEDTYYITLPFPILAWK